MNYNENRFKYLEELTDEELLEERETTLNEIAYLEEVVNDPCASQEQKSEAENSDLPFEYDKLEVLTNIATSRGLIRIK